MATTYELKIYGIEQNPSDFVARSYASEVQHVGFRDKIEHIGLGLGIDGVVYNYEDGTVRILANFDDEESKELFKNNIKFLEKKDNLIKIEGIEEKELKSYIEFPKGINRISADDLVELNKKLDEGVEYIKKIFGVLEDVKKGQNEIIKGQEAIIQGQNEIKEIQLRMLGILEKIEKKL
jgi:acylphosphatase